MGPRLLRRDGASRGGRRLRQLHGRRRPGPHQGQLPRELRAPGGSEADVRSGQPVPYETQLRALTTGPAMTTRMAQGPEATAERLRQAETAVLDLYAVYLGER